MQEIKRNTSGFNNNQINLSKSTVNKAPVNNINNNSDINTQKTVSSSERNQDIENFLQSDKGKENEPFEFNLPLEKIKLDFSSPLTKKILICIAIFLILIVAIYAMAHRKNITVSSGEWYAIKLVNNEVYYGQVTNPTADPVAINNVYYNYQAKDEADQSNNLRLVKRGQETYGPSGGMLVVRSQILYMEPLKKDSKVLGAILEYEK